jgi:putative membrane protein
VLLIAYSISLEFFRKRLENDQCKKDGKFFRAYNEVPTIISILIITFVILKYIPVMFSVGITLFFIFIMYMIVKPSKIDKEKFS